MNDQQALRRIRLCADDYGIAPGVDAAIRDLVARGRLNATSVMVLPATFSRAEADALAICRELYLGGADTTVHGIANSLYLLLWNPKIRAAVDQDREKIGAVIEEAQRLYGSPQWRYRRANQDCVLGGVEVKKDQVLILLHGAGNRDPKQFGECPAEPNLDRPRIRDHLTFNYGPRACVGMGLARIEMRDALNGVLDRLPNVRPDPDAEQPRFANLFMRSYRPLHVRFDC